MDEEFEIHETRKKSVAAILNKEHVSKYEMDELFAV